MALAFLNRCIWRAASSGSGSFVVASAITGFRTPETCANPAVVNAATYRYFAQSDDKTQWEIGVGVYTTADDTLTRATILDSTNSGSVVTFSAAPSVFMGGPLAQDVATAGSQFLELNSGFFGGDLDASNDLSLRQVAIIGVEFSTATFAGCGFLEILRIIDSFSITSLDLTGCAALTRLQCDQNDLSSLDISGLTSLTNATCGGNASMTSLDISSSTLLTNVDANTCALTEAAVDGVLDDLDTAGLSDGTVDLSGGTNSVPSAAGLTSKSNLEGKGWTVTVNV